MKKVFKLMIPVVMVLLVAVAIYIYQVQYIHAKTEPSTDAVSTSTTEAIQSLDKSIAIARQNGSLYNYAIAGRDASDDYGTYIVPGLTATKTLSRNTSDQSTICTSMTPQGITTTPDYVIISAYCHTHRHNSVLYLIDKKTGSFIKEVVLKGKIHAGSIAYDEDHDVLWVAGKKDDNAAVIAIAMDTIKSYQVSSGMAVDYLHDYKLGAITADSFLTYHDSILSIGYFREKEQSFLEQYPVQADGTIKANKQDDELTKDKGAVFPDELYVISADAQGVAYYKDYLIVSESYGIVTSNLRFFQDLNGDGNFTNDEAVRDIKLPEKLEQIWADGDNLYLLFESASYAYRISSFTRLDRVFQIDMTKIDW